MTPISPGMRFLFAILGIAALVPVVLIAINELRAMSSGPRGGPLFVLAFCVIVVFGAISLLIASVRGTASVRRTHRFKKV